MRPLIYCAIFALLISSGTLFPQSRRARVIASRPFPHPHARVIWLHRWCPPLFVQSPMPASFVYQVPYATPYSGADFIPPTPTYVYVGSSSTSHPQLVFKDGVTYTVADYWRVDNELHFVTVEEGGTKSVPHTVPFDDLDVQKTKDAGGAQGFRFVIRDKPIGEWLGTAHQQKAETLKH